MGEKVSTDWVDGRGGAVWSNQDRVSCPRQQSPQPHSILASRSVEQTLEPPA
jgi:hypothetical protein